jgi:hypothetical protein
VRALKDGFDMARSAIAIRRAIGRVTRDAR